jgi:serine/threonine protein kinase
VTHRDIKPENILLSSCEAFSRLMLTDFGLAKAAGGMKSMRTMWYVFLLHLSNRKLL